MVTWPGCLPGGLLAGCSCLVGIGWLGDGVQASARIVKPRLATGSQGFSAFPQGEGIVKRNLAGLKPIDHADQLCAGALVGHGGHVGVGLLRGEGAVRREAHSVILSRRGGADDLCDEPTFSQDSFQQVALVQVGCLGDDAAAGRAQDGVAA